MGEDQGQERAVTNDPEEIRREIEETRQELGDTVAALAEKTDVKARAKDKVDSVKQTIAEKKEAIAPPTAGNRDAQASAALTQVKTTVQDKPIVFAALGALAFGFLLGRITSS